MVKSVNAVTIGYQKQPDHGRSKRAVRMGVPISVINCWVVSRSLGGRRSFSGVRASIYAPEERHQDLARTIRSLCLTATIPSQVFRSFDGAREWLGLAV